MLARGDVGGCRHIGLVNSGQSEFQWGTVTAPREAALSGWQSTPQLIH